MNRATLIYLIVLLACYEIHPSNSQPLTSEQKSPISGTAYDLLVHLEKLVQTDNCKETLVLSKEAINSGNFSTFEYAQIINITSYCHYLNGSHEKALEGYKEILETKSLPADMYLRTAQTLASILVEDKKQEEALKLIKPLVLSIGNTKPELNLLLARILLMTGEADRAIFYLKEIESLPPIKGSEIEENILFTLFLACQQLGNNDEAITYLEILGDKYTRPKYLRHLSNMYGEVERRQDQLAILSLLYENKELKKLDEIETFIYLAIELKNFHRAGSILEKEISKNSDWKQPKKFFLLSQIWLMALEWENSKEALKNAASLSEKGTYFLELAKLYGSKKEWIVCSHSAKKAIEKGLSPNQQDEANFIIGKSLYNQGDFEVAKEHFLAISSKASFYDEARTWAKLINEIDVTSF